MGAVREKDAGGRPGRVSAWEGGARGTGAGQAQKPGWGGTNFVPKPL